jgi:hypothetical protein
MHVDQMCISYTLFVLFDFLLMYIKWVKARRKAIERIYLKERRKINLVHWLGDALGSLLSCSVLSYPAQTILSSIFSYIFRIQLAIY